MPKANENHIVNNEDHEPRSKKSAKHDSGAADLEKVTNYADEKEIKSDVNILSVINDVKRQEAAKKLAQAKELAKVPIKKEDVELIIEQLEIPKTKAERALKQHGGDLLKTLITLTD